MELLSLKLVNFRSYEKLNLSFSSKYNIIYGNNGEGKTNIVEAIYLLALTKSFRCNDDKLMIRFNSNGFVVEGKIKTKLRTKYKIIFDGSTKFLEIDSNSSFKVSDYISKINVILFNPDDVYLIKDAPSERRKLLNIEISKMYKEYLIILNSYNKILKQRNAYLKNCKYNFSREYLDIITEKLIDYGIIISKYRNDFIEKINNFIGNIYIKIFGYGDLAVNYISVYKNKDKKTLLDNYKKIFQKEIDNGKTLMGIHHDDIIFTLDKNKLKDFGSVGQYKNSIISFKLAEIELLKMLNMDSPILILDDLFSEIDRDKINNILKLLDNKTQTFITTTNLENFDMSFINKFKLFNIKQSKIEEIKDGK